MTPFYMFVNNLICDYKKETIDGYELNINKLTLEDKKLFLEYIINATEYEELGDNTEKIEQGFLEYKNYMQKIIDSKLDDAYQDNMHEQGFRSYHHHDNGERGWTRI